MNVLSQVMGFTIVKFFYILFTTVKAFYQRQIPSVTTAINHTIKAGLLAEVYACAKKTLKSGKGYTEHHNTAKRNREIRHNHAKNPRANHKNFGMFRNTTISEFKATFTQVPHENMPNTTIPQTFSM